jgi:ABC-type spermidine/putrescine transport system permease subunit II
VIWRGFTTEWYGELLANDRLLDALGVTLRLALVTVVISVVLGSLLGLAMARIRYRGRAGTETLVLLTMVTPEIVMGLSLLIFFLTLFDAHGSFEQLTVAHVTFCIGYVAITVRARAAGMNRELEEAARDLGANALGAFWHVTLPIIAPGVAAGAMLAFALSFDDYVVTTFNAGVGSSTLPLYIYGRIKFGVTPEINAISTIIVAVTAVAILIAWRAGAFRGERATV